MKEPDPYVVLGVSRDATPEEVRAAFRKAVREHHPDTSSEVDDRDVQKIVDAYRLLIDPASRARYERGGSGPAPRTSGRRVEVNHSGSPRPDPEPVGEICTRCDGRGVLGVERECPACRGRAEVTVLASDRARVVRCRRCAGRGSVSERAACDVCSGWGWVEPG